MSNAGPLSGQIALVTGSTSGLGEAVAHRFVDDGVRGIVVTGRDVPRGEAVAAELRTKGAEVVFAPADLASADGPTAVMDALETTFGTINTLVNAAGLSSRGSIVDTSIDLFDALIAVNVRAPFVLMQGAIDIMRRNQIEGSVINIGSVAAYGALPFLAPYATSKGALMALTKNVAFAMQRDRIRVNQLNIGWMNTPTEHRIQTEVHGQPENWVEIAGATLPFGRLLEPAEVAAAVAWLASDASGMMTGAIIDFDQSVVGAGMPPFVGPDEVP